MKWAFNSSFERICLSHYLGLSTRKYLDPAQWRCSMVWAAIMGLPLFLEGVGTVLGLEKRKLTEGKELIKHFCQPCAPTEANGQRTRNYPYHAQDKWSAFKRYSLKTMVGTRKDEYAKVFTELEVIAKVLILCRYRQKYCCLHK